MPDCVRRPPLLIVGSPRSGTTFLSQIVNRFLDVHIGRDNGTLLRFHRALSRYEPLEDDRNLKRLIDALFKDHFFRTRIRARGLVVTEAELARRVSTRTYAGVIEAIFSTLAEGHGKAGWGYKRASFARVRGAQIDDLFPGARVVHIIRDARDVVLSMRNTPDVLLERSWHFAARDWVSHVETGRTIGHSLGGDRYHEVRYERLMAEPADVLIGILRFSGSGSDAVREERIRHEIGALVRGGNAEKWRRAMPPAAIRTVERAAGPLLRELGYALAYPDVAGQRIPVPELAWLYCDRIWRNLLTRNAAMSALYRLEALKLHLRSRGPAFRAGHD